MPKTEKIDVAKELLDCALYHYLESKSYFACVHLAGAAEEILGQYIKNAGGEPSFNSQMRAAIKISELSDEGKYPSKENDIINLMNYAKNKTKHIDMKDPNDEGYLYYEPKDTAKEYLDRAVTDYYHLMKHHPLEVTERLRQFIDLTTK